MKTYWLLGRTSPPARFVPSFISGVLTPGGAVTPRDTRSRAGLASYQEIQKSHANIKATLSKDVLTPSGGKGKGLCSFGGSGGSESKTCTLC